MFNAKDEEIRELLTENNELWLENFNIKMKIFKAIEYIKENCIDDEFYVNLTNKEKSIIKVLEILGDKENEET
jgi:hypothetical protein